MVGKEALVVNKDFLKQVALIPANFKRGEVKILGNGKIEMAIIAKELKVSAQAKEKIEKAGGKVEA